MEDALRSLLERLSGVATGAAHSHDKPVNIVEELKDALDYLAEDEHPAASAVFLSKDPPGALHHLQLTREMGKPGAEVNGGRAKLLELVSLHLERLGRTAAEPYAKDVQQECLRTFRTERGPTKTVKAASLLPMAALFRMGLPAMTRAETRELAAVLREDYERHRNNTARVKSNILCAIAALHDADTPPGALAAAVEPDAPGAHAVRPADARPAPDPTWLLRAGLATVADDSATALVAEGLEGINSALAAMEARAKGRFEAETEPETESAEEASIDRVTRRKVVDATLASLSLPGAGQRTDKSQAALRLLTRHAHLLARPPGLMDRASPFFHALLRCRTSSNKTIRTLAVPALDEFFRAMTDALSDDGAAPAAEREAIWSQISGEVMRLMDSKEAKAKERTTALRAMGKLARAGVAIGSQAAADLDAMMERVAKWMMADAFQDGGNDFDKRFEAMERQAVMLSTYADLISLQPPGKPVAQSTLDVLVDIVRWVWEHYHTAGDRMQTQLHGCLRDLSRELHARGGATLLAGVMSKVTRPLMALTLRVAPPDPIDSALFRAPPEPLWPKYVSLWVHLLGGDGFAVPGAPDVGENVSTRRNRRGSVSEAVTAAAAAARRRSRSLTLEASGSDRSGLDAPAPESASDPTLSGPATVAYDAFVDEVLQLCHTLQLGVVPARPPTAEEVEESARDQSGTSAAEDRGARPDGSDGSEAMRDALALELGDGVAAADPGDMQTFLCLVDLACAVISAAPAAHVARWLSTLIENLSALSGAHPLLSGFYKIARTALVAAERADAIDHAARCTCRAFLRDVLAGVERQTDELRASALQLLLAAPPGILAPREIDAPLRDALAIGLHHTPLAEAALDALERRIIHRGTGDRRDLETEASYPSLIAALRPYVDRRPSGGDAGLDASAGADAFAAGESSGAGAAYRAARVAARRAHAAELEAEDGAVGRESVETRVTRLLGAAGGAAHAAVDEDRSGSGSGSGPAPGSLWDPTRRVSLDVVSGGGPGGRSVRLTMWLDALLPRAASSALTSADRASKVAASEFLHAATLLMVGRNARRPAPRERDHAREPTPFHLIYRRLFPVILELAVDPEPVTRQLFSSLAYQLARWFTRNQAREAAETVAFLDAITDGLAGRSPSAAFGGSAGSAAGAVAQRRELCASLAAECLKWSVRNVPGGSGGGARGDDGGVAVNVKSILRRLFALQTHPDPSKRLGASLALRRCLGELRDFPAQTEAFALEILETTLRSLRLCDRDPPRAGAEEAGALLTRAAVRACARHAHALCREPPAGTAPRGGTFATLPPLVAWTFAEGTSRSETRARLESQLAFAALVQRLPKFTSPAAWARETREKNGAGWWPFEIREPPPSRETLARGAAASPDELAASAAWFRALVAALHWARWALERGLTTVEDISPSVEREREREGSEGDIDFGFDFDFGSASATSRRHPLVAAAAYVRDGVPPAPADASSSDGSDASLETDDGALAVTRAVREWRRARVKLAVQILVLAERVSSLKSGAGVASFFRALNGGGDGLARLVSLAILAPESLGADTVGGRMDDVHQLAGAAARLLQPMMGEGAAPEVGPTRRAAREHVRRALTIRGDRFDLGHANLFTAEGLAAARRLSAGYRALANVNLLRALLPPEGPASRARLARRLMLVASRVGPDASPARRGAGKALVTLGAHLGVSAEFIAAIVLGDEPPELSARGSGSADGSSSHPRVELGMADGEGVMMGGEGVGEGGARPPRRARDARRAAEAGEAFLQNFPKDVVAACRWHFDKYARTLTRRVVDGGFGETAALRLLTAVLEPPSGSGSASFVEMKILESVAPHLETLATLAKPPRETFADEKDAAERAWARGDGDGVSGEDSTLVRRQRILLGLARRLFALDAACAGLGPGRRRVLFPEGPKTASASPGAVLADAVASTMCPETETFAGEDVGPAQRDALALLPLVLDAGESAAASCVSAAARIARLSRDAGGASAPEGSPEAAAHAAVRDSIVSAFAHARSPALLPAVVAVVAGDTDGGVDAVAAATRGRVPEWRSTVSGKWTNRTGTGTGTETGTGTGTETGTGTGTWPDVSLAKTAWTFAFDDSNDDDERIVAASVLTTLVADAPESAVADFFAERAAAVVRAVDPARVSSAKNPNAAVVTARLAYVTLGAMYARLDASAVAEGPGAVVEKFNAVVSKFAVAELDGVGVSAVASAEANRAFAAWKDRNDTRAEAMDVDHDGFSRAPFDPRPKRVDARRVVETRRAAFSAFAGLLVKTQTKAKFFQRLLEGGAKRWNALAHADETPRLEVETRLIRRRFASRRGDGVNDSVSDGASGANAADPSLAFTLSATLSAGDATLIPPPRTTTTDARERAEVRSSSEDALDDEFSLDELENHPLALGVYGALELASRGGIGDVASLADAAKLHATKKPSAPRLMTLLANLAMDAEVAPVSRLSVVKAALRLHREEFAAAAAAEAAEATKAAEKTSRDAARDGVGPEPEPDVEVVAEKSLEELEMEKLDRAREDGNYLDLTSSQGEVETITTPERPKRDEPSNPPKSFLACHARETLPGLLIGVVDVSRRAGCRVLHATLREAAVATLECDAVWTIDDRDASSTRNPIPNPNPNPATASGTGRGFEKTSAAASLREFVAHVVSTCPSRNAFTLRQNVSLVVQLSSRLVAAAVSAAAASSANDAVSLDRAAAAALRPVLDAVVRLIQSNGEGEDDRLSRSCGIQILGALAMRGTIDLGAPVPLVRHAGVDASPGYPVDERSDAALVCAGTVGCLMRPGDTTGRPLHSAAASLLGVALAQHAATASRRAERSGRDGGEDDMDVDTDGEDEDDGYGEDEDDGYGCRDGRVRATEPRWALALRRRLRKLYDQGPHDAFAIAAERIARRHPAFLSGDDGALVARLHSLALRVHGEPRFVALSALCLAARSDSAAGAAFAERALPELGVILSARDPQVHALTLKTLAAILPSLKEEASRWPHGKRVDVERWRDAATRVESALWNAADASVREAHAEMCAALADAAPALREDPAVRAPLLRALASARGEPAGALAHWNETLPGGGRDEGGYGGGGRDEGLAAGSRDEGLATAGHVGRRLRAALRVLPTAPTASAAAATAAGWLAATCRVVFAVAKTEEAFHAPLCEDDLALCEFREAVVDTAWQGASLPMAPLFSTQASQGGFSGSAATAGISAGMASATRGSLDAPSRGSLDAPSLAAPTTPGYRRARPGLGPGFVLATPAPSVDVGATELGAATLSATSTSLAAGFAATQAELPPWLRRLATGTQAGGDAIFDAPANTLASKPARRHVGVESSIGIGSASFGVGLRDTRLRDASDSRDAMVAMAERRRRVERERASARKRAVSLVRRYRAGELPDVRAATPAALLDPLVALARRDAAVAAALLTSILDAALAADDAFQCSDRRGDGGKRTRADVPSTTHGPVVDGVRDAFAAGPLRRDVRAAVSALLPAASSDPSLAAWALETVAADPGASISNCAAIRAAATISGRLAAGVVALESRASHALGVRAESARAERTLESTPGGAKRRRTDGGEEDARVAGKRSNAADDDDVSFSSEMASLREALASLHRASGDDESSRLCLADASANDFRTRSAVAAQLEGDARIARDAYDGLLEDARAGTIPAPSPSLERLWRRERLRCSQRLGDWETVFYDVEDAVAPPWTVESLSRGGDRNGVDEIVSADDRVIPGSAAGGGILAAAVRAMIRAPAAHREEDARVDETLARIFAHPAAAPGGFLADELGVELAVEKLRAGAEDVAATRVAAVRRCFRLRWLAAHPRATATRRALLQSLQPATELEEVITFARAARLRREDPDAGARIAAALLDRWSSRWPSNARDPPEVWERVAETRRAGLEAFERLAPNAVVASPAFAAAVARDEISRLLRTAKGLARAGEATQAQDMVNRAKECLAARGARGTPPPAAESWRVQKAMVKLVLARVAAPTRQSRGSDFLARESRASSDDGKLLDTILESMLRLQARGSLDAYPAAAAEAATSVGRLAEAAASLARRRGVETSVEFARLDALAFDNYARAVALASRDDPNDREGSANAARRAAKASLRLALFCDGLPAAAAPTRDGTSSAGSSALPGSPAFDAIIHPLGVEPTLVRHAMLALAGGAAGTPRARHLIPRVLAILRGVYVGRVRRDSPESDASRVARVSASAEEFTRLFPRVPSWYFLEWIPQMLSLLDVHGPGGESVVAPLETLAASYPSATHPEYHLARESFGADATRRSAGMARTLRSPARDAFARAVTLLDFPTQRLAWWRARVRLMAARGADDAAFDVVADAAARDVADPDEPGLGNFNHRFARMAKTPLTRALGGVGPGANRPKRAMAWMPKAFADVERVLAERWHAEMSKSESLPRLSVAHFSRWFATYEPPPASGSVSAGADSVAFRAEIEIPGQYDALACPPDPSAHARVVGFEPEVDVFASKQRPKRLVLRGSDGREYPFLAKGSEDLRQDDRIERLFRAMDALLAAAPAARGRGLHVRTFHVAPLTRRAGLIEFVDGAVPMLDALGGKNKRADAVIAKHQTWIKAQALAEDPPEAKAKAEPPSSSGGGGAAMLRRRPPGGKVPRAQGGATQTHYLDAIARVPVVDAVRALATLSRHAARASTLASASAYASGIGPLAAAGPRPALRDALVSAASSPEAFLASRRRYAASLAASGVCGWVAGVGDRHPQNILVDLRDGSLVHIDFGYAFGTAVAALPIPELTPFRATEATLGPLAPGDARDALAGDMRETMRALREGSALLRGVMDVFLREPLDDWQREARQVRVKAGREVEAREENEGNHGSGSGSDSKTLGCADAPPSAMRAVEGASGLEGDEGKHVELKIAHAWAKLELGNPCHVAVAQCAAKHEGRAHWDGLRDAVLGRGGDAPGEANALAGGRRTKARLAAGETCASVEEQMACLLELATDPVVLATSWSGWRPWL